MKTYNYIGTFKSKDNNIFKLGINCKGFEQAFFLLIASALRQDKLYKQGKRYCLEYIENDKRVVKHVDDIVKCTMSYGFVK